MLALMEVPHDIESNSNCVRRIKSLVVTEYWVWCDSSRGGVLGGDCGGNCVGVIEVIILKKPEI